MNEQRPALYAPAPSCEDDRRLYEEWLRLQEEEEETEDRRVIIIEMT